MPPELLSVVRWVHVGGGFVAVGLGLAVMLLPKTGPRAGWHRRAGWVYAGCLGASALVGVPLSYLRGNLYLMALGAGTLALIVTGWGDAVAAREAARRGQPAEAARRLRWHLILMGSSYVAAWSGFFANNFILGTGPAAVLAYVYGPPAIGAVFIARAAVRRPS